MLFWWYHHKKLHHINKKHQKMIFSFWLFPEKCNSWWFSVDYPLLPANSGVLSLFTVDTNNFTSEKMRQTSGELKKMPKFLRQKWTSAAALTPPVVLNSETKSLKIDPKVPNRRYRRGLQTGHWRNPGSYSKKRIFGPKSGPVARKRPAERPNGHLLGAWVNFFFKYRQVGYPERRNDMSWSYSIVSVH